MLKAPNILRIKNLDQNISEQADDFFWCYIAWRGHSNYFSVLFIAGYAKTMWRDLAVMLHGSNYCVDVFPDRVRNTVIRISSFILLLPD